MSRDNVEIVKQVWRRFGETGEPDFSSAHPDVEVHDHDLPDAGTYRGHDGFLHWMEHWGRAWETYSLRPQEFIDAGDHVVVIVETAATGSGSGLTVRRQDGMVCELRDGMIVRVDYFSNRRDALRAAGLGE